MIKRALQKQADINSFLFALESDTDEQNTIPAEDRLSHDDWRMLAEIMQLLQPLYLQTMRTQGWGKGHGHGRLWEVITGVEYLLEHLEDWRGFYNEISTDIAAQSASQVATRTPSLSPPPDIVLTASQRPSRTRQLPARLTDFDVITPTRASRRRRRRRHLQAQNRFNEASLPEHTREAYTAAPQEISLRDRLTKHHQAAIRKALDSCWSKLNCYYIKLGESPVYAAAIILHPRLGLGYLEANWDQREWIQVAKDSLKGFLDRWYYPHPEHEIRQGHEQEPQQHMHENDQFDQWINSRVPCLDAAGDELGRYFGLGPQDPDDIIQWWLDHMASFPTVGQLALDIWAIPAMATECERRFSTAKLTVTSQRNSISPELLNEIQCLKQWLKHLQLVF